MDGLLLYHGFLMGLTTALGILSFGMGVGAYAILGPKQWEPWGLFFVAGVCGVILYLAFPALPT